MRSLQNYFVVGDLLIYDNLYDTVRLMIVVSRLDLGDGSMLYSVVDDASTFDGFHSRSPFAARCSIISRAG